jgi:hypothetical protein
MIFCQMNILEQSLSFHGDYKRRCLLTMRVSLILSLIGLIPEISIYHTKRIFHYNCRVISFANACKGIYGLWQFGQFKKMYFWRVAGMTLSKVIRYH